MSALYSSVLTADSQYSDMVDCSALYGVTKLRVTVDRGSARVSCGASSDTLTPLQDCLVGVTDVRLPMLPYVSVARLSGNSSAIKVEVLGPEASELSLTSEYSVSGAGISADRRMLAAGDSFGYQSNGGVVGGMTLTRSGGIVTVTGATGHNLYPGALLSVRGAANASDEADFAACSQYLSPTSFTYPHAGPDGVIAAGPQTISIVNHQIQQSAGFFANWNRLAGGAYRMVGNAGVPGALTSVAAMSVANHARATGAGRVVWFAGYNDINGDAQTLAQTVANIVAAVAAYPSAFWDVFATSPWLSGAAAGSAAHLRQVTRYYGALQEAFKANPRVRVHNTAALIGATTGYANTGYIKASDKIHPTWRMMWECAKYLWALEAVKPTGVALPTTALDTRANDAASKHVLDNPLMTGTGGSAITNVTGSIPTGYSGQLSSTGNATTGTSAITSRSDGFGNDWGITYTPATADTALRMSYSLDTTRFVSGGVIDKIVAKLSVSGLSSSNAANIKSAQMALVWIADGVTYAASVQEASSTAEAASASQQENIVDLTVCLRDIPVPAFAALTLARLDFTVSHYGSSATAVTVKVGRVDVELA